MLNGVTGNIPLKGTATHTVNSNAKASRRAVDRLESRPRREPND